MDFSIYDVFCSQNSHTTYFGQHSSNPQGDVITQEHKNTNVVKSFRATAS